MNCFFAGLMLESIVYEARPPLMPHRVNVFLLGSKWPIGILCVLAGQQRQDVESMLAKRWHSLTLVQRRRQWTNAEPTSIQLLSLCQLSVAVYASGTD